MTEEEQIKTEEPMPTSNVIPSTTSPGLTKNNIGHRIKTTSSMSQSQYKIPSSLYTTNNSNKRFKDNEMFSSSQTINSQFNTNLAKCYENLSNLKDKMKTMNHSSTQKILTNQMFTTQMQKSKEDYNKLKSTASVTVSEAEAKCQPIIDPEHSIYLSKETESYYVSNQILNKTNVDLVNQLKSMENHFQYNKTIQSRMKDMNEYIERLKLELGNANKNRNDLLMTIDSLNNKVNLLIQDNKILNDKCEDSSNVYEHLNKAKIDYEKLINELQMKNEAVITTNIIKGKECDALINKLALSEQMNASLKKTIADYEELIANMKKTIQILTNQNMNQAIIELKGIIKEKEIIISNNANVIKQLQGKLQSYEQRDIQLNYQSKPIKLMMDNTKEIVELNDKEKNELDIVLKSNDQLARIIKEKDALIEQLKANYLFLNDSLLTIQRKQENVLAELRSLGIGSFQNKNPQLNYSDSQQKLFFNTLKENAEEINTLLLNATNHTNDYNTNNSISQVYYKSKPEPFSQLKYQSEIDKNKSININYDQLTYENEQLKTENMLLKSECEAANKKFNQILNDQTSMYLQTSTSQQQHQQQQQQTTKLKTQTNQNTALNELISNRIGNLCLFRIYDSKRIIRFDLSQKDYQIVEFIDYDSFDSNYNSNGSIILNTFEGCFILTGKDNTTLYYYNNENISMSKITQFNFNHSHGALLLDEMNNSIIALSGWHNTKIERYTNTKLIHSPYPLSKSKSTNMTNLPDMSIERSESGYLYYNNDTIFSFFGFCHPQSKYINTVEYLLMNTSTRQCSKEWQTLNFTLENNNISYGYTSIKSQGIAMINEDEVLLLGGFNGLKEIAVDKLLRFDIKAMTFEEINRKLPKIDINHCYDFGKESQFISYEDENNSIFLANIDEMDNVHIIETSSLNYDLLKFD